MKSNQHVDVPISQFDVLDELRELRFATIKSICETISFKNNYKYNETRIATHLRKLFDQGLIGRVKIETKKSNNNQFMYCFTGGKPRKERGENFSVTKEEREFCD